jgi:hypothetical protein
MLQQQINAIASRSGGKVSPLRDITLGENPGFEFEMTGARDGDAKARMFQVRDTFVIAAVSAKENLNAENAKRFLESFQLAGK